MPSTPDPQYWGNPPQTPRSKNIPQQSAQAKASAAFDGHQPTADQPTGCQPPFQSASPTGQDAHGGQPDTSYQASQAYAGFQAPTAPPAPSNRPQKHTGIIIAITIIAAVLVGMGGCVACSAVVSTAFDNPDNTWYTHDNSADQNGSGMGMPQNEQEQLNNETRRSFGIAGKSALSSAELNDIQAHTFNNASKMPDSNGAYAPGVYYVGTDIPAGGYWLTGKEDELSNFYILKPSGTGQATLYNTVHVNSYYGHNLTNLEDGEVLILDNDGTMVSLDQMKETFSAPYGSGVYRVGVDVPEGTYQLVVGDGADDYSACYVMADLDYDETSSYLYSDYFVKGDKAGTVTLKAGTYIELYNMQMKPDGLA